MLETEGWTRTSQTTATVQLPTGLRVRATLDMDSPVLVDFFAGYDRAFVLPNEKETLAGFQECLSLNSGRSYTRLAATYGPFCEVVFTVHSSDPDARVAGGNFIACPLDATGQTLALNLNYVFSEREVRGQGLLRQVLDALPRIVALFLRPPVPDLPKPLVFFEQNDPLRMSAAEYLTDSQHAGLDQVDRLAVWQRVGARLLDFAYVQPALSDAQAPDDTLLYSVLGAQERDLDACVLAAHLRRFFGISVLKGEPISSSPVALAQLETLARACAKQGRVPLLSIAAGLRALPSTRPPSLDSAVDFRSLARSAGLPR